MTRVIICGLTNPKDALVAAEAGADFLGFIFYPPSPRYVTPERACRIIEAVRRSPFAVHFVGVFVDDEPSTVRKVMARSGLEYAQLHGAEPPETVTTLMDWGLSVIKAFRVRDVASLAEIGRYRATAYLLDAYVPGQPGGTGHTFDWALAVQAGQYGPIILAGGLTSANVAQAVRATHPWGVDVSSGVEAEPGRKDADRMRRFVAAAKSRTAEGTR